MKKLFAMIAGAAGLLFLSSCTDYGTYGYSASYHSGGYGGYGGYPVSTVGFIGTNYGRWGYDPYRRSYYDYTLRRYYNHHNRSYYSALPRRYGSPYYPSGYRHGRRLNVPTYFPHLQYRGHNDRRLRSHDYRRGNYPASGRRSYNRIPKIHPNTGRDLNRGRNNSKSWRSNRGGQYSGRSFNRGGNRRSSSPVNFRSGERRRR